MRCTRPRTDALVFKYSDYGFKILKKKKAIPNSPTKMDSIAKAMKVVQTTQSLAQLTRNWTRHFFTGVVIV